MKGLPCAPIESRVQPFTDSLDIWEAFWLLHGGREYTDSGPLPLRLSEIKTYMEIFPPIRHPKDLVSFIYVLDRQYLSHLREMSEKRSKKQSEQEAEQAAAGRSIPNQRGRKPPRGRHNNNSRS